jgi:hypothetical protein
MEAVLIYNYIILTTIIIGKCPSVKPHQRVHEYMRNSLHCHHLINKGHNGDVRCLREVKGGMQKTTATLCSLNFWRWYESHESEYQGI